MNKLPDKIHYQKFDSLGRVTQVLVDNDAKENTGKAQTDNGGEAVNGIDQVLEYGYNVKGEQVSLLRDNNMDGKYDYREAYTLDANGRRVQKETDLTNDGTFDNKEVYTREADGGLTRTDFYNLVDNREVLTKIEHYELNVNNQRKALKVDTLGDSSIDAITRYDLDALGRIEKAYFDTDGDNNVDRVESYTQDALGNILRTERDTDNDGQPNSVVTYERDALGRMIAQNVDEGNDNIIDIRAEYVRDVYGNAIVTKNFSYNPVTKTLDAASIVEATFNTDNKVSVEKRSDIVANRETETNYNYDDYGRRDTTYVTNKATGVTTSYSYTYNPDNSYATRSDFDRNGNLSSKTVYTSYDPATGGNTGLDYYNANNELVYKSFRYLDTRGNTLNSLYDYANNGDGWDSFFFGGASASSNIHTTVDMTTWKEEQLAQLGESLSLIRMANGSVSTVTLNAEVVAKISNGGLRVQGAADNNDILNLSGFEKAASSTVRNYDLYTATVDGEALNLYVQNNVDVNIIGG